MTHTPRTRRRRKHPSGMVSVSALLKSVPVAMLFVLTGLSNSVEAANVGIDSFMKQSRPGLGSRLMVIDSEKVVTRGRLFKLNSADSSIVLQTSSHGVGDPKLSEIPLARIDELRLVDRQQNMVISMRFSGRWPAMAWVLDSGWPWITITEMCPPRGGSPVGRSAGSPDS